ncbi:MAG TPA: putative DNA modification/repair radical SAM protein [Spirochaetales bacterium]|nr:putative DNA modification/repair radical SAM protein [Spirochaetales bacterium]
MDIEHKIDILADAAKYDASCATSGSARCNSEEGIGSAAVGGICHSWSADGRCISLLKVLLSNVCAYDCAYCVNRRSNDIPRAAFEEEELIRLIVEFYRRNYIEGAFLSSAVTGSPNITMERLIHVAKTLRTREHFNGYLHLKIIPGASQELVLEAARWADRASVNIELPSAASLARIAPDKTPQAIFGPMRALARASGFEPTLASAASTTAAAIAPTADAEKNATASAVSAVTTNNATALTGVMAPAVTTADAFATPAAMPGSAALAGMDDPRQGQGLSVFDARHGRPRDPKAGLIPAGQSTQLVIGASPEPDTTILTLAENLYLAFDVRRVYYSAFIPTGGDPRLPAVSAPPLAREHRLYQADWLFRFYGFTANEILDVNHPFLDLDIDPKSSWALRNLAMFPIEVNKAPYLDLLRVPGIGRTSAKRIVQARRSGPLSLTSLPRLGVVMKRARWFLTVSGRIILPDDFASGRGFANPRSPLDNPEFLRSMLADPRFKEQTRKSRASMQMEFEW